MADRYLRFSPAQRIEHLVQMVAFTALAVTGIPQRYHGAWLSEAIIDMFGGIENTRIIHRIYATALMVAVVYHFGSAAYRKFVLRRPPSMLPTGADVRNAFQSVGYALRLRRTPPRQGRFTWEEKVEYWSLVWGTVIMVVTGFLLWNPIATAQLLPGQFIPAAKAAHSGEALLAVLAILVWHSFHVHLRSFNTSMFTGYMSRAEMAHEHPLELEAIESGAVPPPPAGEERQRLRRRFYVSYGAVAVLLLAGIYLFVTFEDTAIETIDPVEGDVRVFAPVETTLVPPGPTTSQPPATSTTEPATPGALTWNDTFGPLLAQECGACHGGGQQMGGVDLSTYQAALAVITPGDPEGSTLYAIQAAGGHPGQLEAGEVEALGQWIADGAPEGTGGEAPPAEEPATTTTEAGGEVTWDTGVSDLLAASCGACHGGGQQMGGVDLSTYAGALEQVVPGDPEESELYEVQVEGGHPGQLDEAGLETIRAWIAAGAPQGP